MNSNPQLEHRASSSRTKHEGESSFALCDRLSRTRENSQRQLPTDQDYAVSTREYQTDQSSLKNCSGCCWLCPRKTNNKTTATNPQIAQVDTVTPYQGNKLARTALVQCALPTKRYGSFLQNFYPRIQGRRGGKANIALARKFLGVIYHTLKNCVFEGFPNFVLAS